MDKIKINMCTCTRVLINILLAFDNNFIFVFIFYKNLQSTLKILKSKYSSFEKKDLCFLEICVFILNIKLTLVKAQWT